jgi:recombinational DNA repair ATPase RecF
MVRGISILLMSSLVVVLLGVGALIVWPEPSTRQLDEDVARIRSEITEASAEAAKYSGGLIKALIDVRSEVLKTTESMLRAKRLSWLRRINLNFIVSGKLVDPARPEALAKIESDIRESERRLQEAEIKAQQYSGGLLQSMMLLNVETERVTRSQLLLAYYSAKYGLAAPTVPPVAGSSSTKPGDMGPPWEHSSR